MKCISPSISMHTCATLIWNVPHSHVYTHAQNPRNCKISIDMMRMSLQYGCFIFIFMPKHPFKVLICYLEIRTKNDSIPDGIICQQGPGDKEQKGDH